MIDNQRRSWTILSRMFLLCLPTGELTVISGLRHPNICLFMGASILKAPKSRDEQAPKKLPEEEHSIEFC